MHLPGRPVVAYDPEGLIFGAGINSESIKLYDLRSFDKVSSLDCTLFCLGIICSSIIYQSILSTSTI